MDCITQEKGDILSVRFPNYFRTCNFSCPYCIADLHSIDHEWKYEENYHKIIQHLVSLPFSLNVRLGPAGEFFLSKSLIKGAECLSHSKNVISVNLLTNLSFSPAQYDKFFERVNKSKIAIVASFHPTEVKDRKTWMKTACYMQEEFDFSVVLVAYPPLIKKLPVIKEALNNLGIEVAIQGLIGKYNEREYPFAYTSEEKMLLRKICYSRHDYEFWIEAKKPGLCNAGYKSIFVDIATGNVLSCGMGNAFELGNLFSGNGIKLNDGPRPCMNKTCLCDTENLNVVTFEQHYRKTGLNFHKYEYKFAEKAKEFPLLDEWEISY
ncbi:MAG: hypothetical protein MRK02_09910 [Candidatus Scalindua sp.]|nr:hypothetical protein [Candidatus Scalindua sp.]